MSLKAGAGTDVPSDAFLVPSLIPPVAGKQVYSLILTN